MTRAAFLIPLAAVLSWIAVAEILSGDDFLGLNTIAAAIFVLASPWLFQPAHDETPTADLPLPADSTPTAGAFGVAPAATDRGA